MKYLLEGKFPFSCAFIIQFEESWRFNGKCQKQDANQVEPELPVNLDVSMANTQVSLNWNGYAKVRWSGHRQSSHGVRQNGENGIVKPVVVPDKNEITF